MQTSENYCPYREQCLELAKQQARGLHSNNIGRNTATRQAMQTDKDYKFVR